VAPRGPAARPSTQLVLRGALTISIMTALPEEHLTAGLQGGGPRTASRRRRCVQVLRCLA